MAQDPFGSPKLLLSNARKHIDNLNAAGNAFAETKPYASVCELDAETGEYVYKIRVTAPMPGNFALLAADALSNLKSVLDQALCASVAILRPSASLDGISFPFGRSKPQFDAAEKVGCKKVASEIVTLIRSFQPYETGNAPLWLMNFLTKTNRHRMLQPVLLMGENMIRARLFSESGQLTFMAPDWDRSKH